MLLNYALVTFHGGDSNDPCVPTETISDNRPVRVSTEEEAGKYGSAEESARTAEKYFTLKKKGRVTYLIDGEGVAKYKIEQVKKIKEPWFQVMRGNKFLIGFASSLSEALDLAYADFYDQAQEARPVRSKRPSSPEPVCTPDSENDNDRPRRRGKKLVRIDSETLERMAYPVGIEEDIENAEYLVALDEFRSLLQQAIEASLAEFDDPVVRMACVYIIAQCKLLVISQVLGIPYKEVQKILARFAARIATHLGESMKTEISPSLIENYLTGR
jgi:hypothetical protein